MNLKISLLCLAGIALAVSHANAACGGGGNKQTAAAKTTAAKKVTIEERAEIVDLDATIVAAQNVNAPEARRPSEDGAENTSKPDAAVVHAESSRLNLSRAKQKVALAGDETNPTDTLVKSKRNALP